MPLQLRTGTNTQSHILRSSRAVKTSLLTQRITTERIMSIFDALINIGAYFTFDRSVSGNKSRVHHDNQWRSKRSVEQLGISSYHCANTAIAQFRHGNNPPNHRYPRPMAHLQNICMRLPIHQLRGSSVDCLHDLSGHVSVPASIQVQYCANASLRMFKTSVLRNEAFKELLLIFV